MEENIEMVPMQDIAFAAKKDGSFIANFNMGGGKSPDVEAVSALFRAVTKYIKESPEREFVMFSMIYFFEHRNVSEALVERVKSLKTDKNEQE